MGRSWRQFVARPVPGAWSSSVYAAATAAFVIILLVRGGPNPAETDAHAVTFPTTAISHGDLRLAQQQTLVPDPPGYPLLTAPLVVAFRPWIGAPRWCDGKAIPAALRGTMSRFYLPILDPCSAPRSAHLTPLPPWYRSQALLVVAAWLVLLAGVVMLVRAMGRGRTVGEGILVVGLVALPATTDAIAQSFHPQDLMCVGFACWGIAELRRGRWYVAGGLLGLAFLCKQFAVLPLLAVIASAPGWRSRARIVTCFVGVVGLGVVPFFLADRIDTVHALSGIYVAGVGIIKTPTVLGLMAIAEQTKLEMARDLPVVLGGGFALWAWWRARERLAQPVPLIGLTLACLSARLVFEVSMWNYYFLAVGVFLLLLDFVRESPPWRSLAWIAAARYGLPWIAAVASPPLTAAAFLIAALIPVAMGLAVVARAPRPRLVEGRIRPEPLWLPSIPPPVLTTSGSP